MRKIVVLFALLLAACQTTGSTTIGSGPITLSPAVQSYFDQYMDINGLMFAVAVDGRSWATYRYCPDIKCRDAPGERQLTIDHCEKNSKGVPCKIYALRKEIVWDFDGGVDPVSANPTGDFRKMEIEWEGQELLTTTIDLNDKDAKLALSNGVVCDGDSQAHANGSSGTWVIVCSDGLSAEGTYTALGKGKGAIGKGIDHFGKEVRYTIFPKGSV